MFELSSFRNKEVLIDKIRTLEVGLSHFDNYRASLSQHSSCRGKLLSGTWRKSGWSVVLNKANETSSKYSLWRANFECRGQPATLQSIEAD